MTETRKRIKELKDALPRARERIVAVAVLLAMSVTMMATVSYAWYTMSFAPEVTGINTTVTSNGNLEIALSDLNGLQPDSSAVGDSFSAEGQTTHGANTSWGNLINLSSGYGIEDLVLRPAKFSSDSKYYLSSAKYTEDGRVEGITTDFAFTTWTETGSVGDKVLHNFTVPTGAAFGVRAISSVGYGEGGKSLMLLKMDAARAELAKCTKAYIDLVSAPETKETIRDIVNIYLNYYIHKAVQGTSYEQIVNMVIDGDSDITEQMPALVIIFEAFYEAVLLYGDALDYLADVQEEFGATKVDLGTAKKTYESLVGTIESDLNTLKEEAKEPTTSIEEDPEVLAVINRFIHIDSSIINGGGIENTTVRQLTRNPTSALGTVMGWSGTQELTVTVTQGGLHTFEQLHGTHATMRLEKLKLAIKTVNGTMHTNATGNLYEDAIGKTQDMDTSALNNMEAKDTYGMVVDLWFRTNSPDGTLLTLDGLVETETYYVDRVTKLTGESKSRNVYAYDRPTGVKVAGIDLTEEVLVFRGEKGDTNYEEGSYYNIYTLSKVFIAKVETVDETDENGNVVKDKDGNVVKKNIVVNTDTPIGDGDVSIKRDAYERVVGFNSSNRYDGDYTYTDGDEISATQGTGTCFVFYADTPEETAAAMELLKHLKLAFMDADGNMLAQASMDVEHVFSESGKHTVPIIITDTQATAVDNEGNTIYGVTAMQKNVPIRISVVVYLDGENLENSMAFSNGAIQGSMNFQFSTNENLNALKNTDLSNKIIELSASIGQDRFERYTGTIQTTTLSAIVDGLVAEKVEAVFQRRINSTQGTRMAPIIMTHQDGTNTWSGTAGFLMPGTYVLNSLWIDGVEFTLPQSITVVMGGFAVNSVAFCDGEGEDVAMTADGYVDRAVSVKFDTDAQPISVQARFESDNGAFSSARLSLDANGSWSGTARFSSSGTYKLKYLVLVMADGKETYYELEPDHQKEFTAYLGLRASVSLDDSRANISFEYTGLRTIQVKVEIFTDTDDVIRGLENVSLKYGKRGSTVDANGLYASLRWENGAYYGEFKVDKAGVFNFTRLVVEGTDEITVASEAPSITAISLEPPEYISSVVSVAGAQTESDILIIQNPDNKIYFAAKILEASSAEIEAVLTRSENGKTVKDTISVPASYDSTLPDFGEDYYYFQIPMIDANDNRNGVWTVTELLFANVYDESGKEYTADDPYKLPVGRSFTVVEQSVSIDTKEFGNNTSATFMTSYPLRKPNAANTGYEYEYGAQISFKGIDLSQIGLQVSDVKLTLTHKGDSEALGGYTYDTGDAAVVEKMKAYTQYAYDLTQNAAGKWVVSDADASVRLAGTYRCVLTFKLVGTGENAGTVYATYSVENKEGIKVRSVKSSVTISSISPSGPHTSLKVTSAVTADQVNVESKIEGNTAKVYQKATKTGKWYNPKYTLVEEPKVTLRLSNMGAAAGASMTFTTEANSGTVYMYTGGTHTGQTPSFTWTPTAQTCMRYIGYNDAGSCNETKVAGTLKSSTVILTFDSVNFTVAVSEITIINVQPT